MDKNFKNNKKFPILWSFFLAFFGIIFLILVLFRKKDEEIFEKEIKVEEVGLTPRQEEIVGILSQKGEITVEELIGVIKGVSERTFRRDMQKLEELGISRKEGNTKGSKYIYTK